MLSSILQLNYGSLRELDIYYKMLFLISCVGYAPQHRHPHPHPHPQPPLTPLPPCPLAPAVTLLQPLFADSNHQVYYCSNIIFTFEPLSQYYVHYQDIVLYR